jgi:hypothetical protein
LGESYPDCDLSASEKTAVSRSFPGFIAKPQQNGFTLKPMAPACPYGKLASLAVYVSRQPPANAPAGGL